ncbi:hypothetical protein SBA4_3400016 [Candidatus Sulfopaludibacter sp. SbA4]|nr:hypothetical protein SBA4_3400016 [Candidatus Sulfopaludibacter sp. SbA4]
MRVSDGELTTRIVILRKLSSQDFSLREPLPRGRLLLFQGKGSGVVAQLGGHLRVASFAP